MKKAVPIFIVAVTFGLMLFSMFVEEGSAGTDMVDVTRTFQSLFENDANLKKNDEMFDNNLKILCEEMKKVQEKIGMEVFMKEPC